MAAPWAATLPMLALAGACASGELQPTTAPARALPADSAALLAEALRLVRPAFATQDDALRAGAYAAAADRPVATPRPTLAHAAGTLPAAAPAVYVIQIAAYRDRKSADVAATAAGRHYPELAVLVEAAGEHFRVALGSFPASAEARLQLRSVQQRYPDAWVRRTAP